MSLAFDHLVHFIRRTPAEAASQMCRLGFHALNGGRHQHWGTANSLCYFDLSYLEFLAVEEEKIASRSDNPLIQQLAGDLARFGEGVGQVALRTTDIHGWAKRLRRHGLNVTGPVPGSRQREDGSVIRWSMLFAASDQVHLPLPFLIEWEQPDEERRTDLTQRGIIAAHPNNVTRVDWIAYAAADAMHASERWQEWFGLSAENAYVDDRLQAMCRLIRCPGGNILLCSPLEEGITADALAARGERPFAVQFGGSAGHRRELVMGSWYYW